MSIYPQASIDAQHINVNTFRAEEGYVTFYPESGYVPGRLRSAMTPVGKFLFINGLTIQESVSELPPIQSFGSDYANLTGAASVGSSLQITALYTQEGTDLTWSTPGHPELMAYIDFIDATPVLKSGDVLNSASELSQTVVARNLRCVNRTIAAQDSNGVSYSLSFNGGRVAHLANNTMDL